MRGCEQTHSDAYSCWKMAARSRQTDKVVQTVAFFLCISFFFFQTNRLSRQRSSGPRWLIGHSVYKRAEGLCEVEKSLPMGGKNSCGIWVSLPFCSIGCKNMQTLKIDADGSEFYSWMEHWSLSLFFCCLEANLLLFCLFFGRPVWFDRVSRILP